MSLFVKKDKIVKEVRNFDPLFEVPKISPEPVTRNP